MRHVPVTRAPHWCRTRVRCPRLSGHDARRIRDRRADDSQPKDTHQIAEGLDATMADQGSPRVRRMYSHGGRRIRVRDLVHAGLLSPGTELIFHRPRIGDTYRSLVTDQGRLRLPDGEEFVTPSTAATAASGTPADGWFAWTLADSGEPLDSLRQRYLDVRSGEVPQNEAPELDGESVVDGSSATAALHAFLKGARQDATNGSPRQMQVRDLIGQWGATGRSPTVDSALQADLANHGLTTDPDFRKVGLETTVFLRTAPTEEDAETASAPATTDEDDDRPETGLTVGNLPSALRGVESITPQTSFEEAITLMLLNDYSQLAVLNGPTNLRGAISWKSIAQARHANANASIVHAIVHVEAVPYETELVDILRRLYDEDFVFVRGPHRRISGIVTAADLVLAYGTLATPFFLVGEIDSLLRRLMRRTFPIGDIVAACDVDGSRGLRDFNEMTVGDYMVTLEKPALWERLEWPIDRRVFIRRLDDIRQIRNDIMHFNADPLPDNAVSTLRNFAHFLRSYTH